MPLFRCLNCRRDFEAEKPVCEPCGLDPSRDPRDGQYIVERSVIHFDKPHAKVVGRGVGHAACNPALKTAGRSGVGFTGEKPAVTCPACKETAAFLSKEPPPMNTVVTPTGETIQTPMPALPVTPMAEPMPAAPFPAEEE